MKFWELLRKNEQGQIAVLAALMMVVLIGFIGLAVDLSMLTYQKQKLQDVVDLVALAGAQELVDNPSNAVQKTKDFSEMNGVPREDIRVTVPYEGSADKIHVEATKVVNFFLLPVLGIDSKELTVSSTAGVAASVFDYVFFTNSGMSCSVGNSIFYGSVHSNNNFESSGGGNVFTSALEVVGKLSLKNDTVYQGTVIHPATFVPMPDFNVDYFRSKATVIYDKLPNTSILDVNGIVFVNSDIDLNGLKVRGNGSIVTVGNIKSSNGFSGETSNDYANLISLEGNITITGGGKTFAGGLCAPKGEIVLTGGGDTYIGTTIGNKIRISSGNYTFIYDPRVKAVLSDDRKKTIHLID